MGLWLQIVGRALRPSEGKTHATIIDHTDNWERLGLPDIDREWSLDPVSMLNARWGRLCPWCGHVFTPTHSEMTNPIGCFSHSDPEDGIAIIPIHRSECPNCGEPFEFSIGQGGGAIEEITAGEDEKSVDTPKAGLGLRSENTLDSQIWKM